MKVSLFIPCLTDQFFPRVGMNLYKILRKAGAQVDYPEDQTCCGQPALESALAGKRPRSGTIMGK